MKSVLAICLIALAVTGAFAGLSECQRKREDALRSRTNPKANQTNIHSVGLIVECNDDGSYKALQCFPPAVGGGRFCLCYDPEGQVVKSPSKSTKSCACYLEKYKRERKSGSGSAPACESDGTFKKVQCGGGSWWCVDPATGAMKGSKHSGACSAAKC